MADGIKILKASYKGCPVIERALFKQSRCLLPISVGQKVHEAEKFNAIIQLVNRTFKECVILIDDIIQRYTLQMENINVDAEYLYEQSIKEGILWKKRNCKIYNKLTIPYKVITWKKWLEHAKFSEAYERIEKEYKNNSAYKKAMNDNIEEFLIRYKKNNKNLDLNIDYELAFALCRSYLKEECACMCLWVEEDCQFEVYPFGRNKAMAATYDFIIKPQYPNLLKSVALRFKKYPAKKKVNFEEDDDVLMVAG